MPPGSPSRGGFGATTHRALPGCACESHAGAAAMGANSHLALDYLPYAFYGNVSACS